MIRRADPQLSGSFYAVCGNTSARLVTKGTMAFPYGLVKARMKLLEAPGCWPALWMLGENLDEAGWPACGEIDVMEHFGDGSMVVHGTIHGPGTKVYALRQSEHAIFTKTPHAAPYAFRRASCMRRRLHTGRDIPRRLRRRRWKSSWQPFWRGSPAS